MARRPLTRSGTAPGVRGGRRRAGKWGPSSAPGNSGALPWPAPFSSRQQCPPGQRRAGRTRKAHRRPGRHAERGGRRSGGGGRACRWRAAAAAAAWHGGAAAAAAGPLQRAQGRWWGPCRGAGHHRCAGRHHARRCLQRGRWAGQGHRVAGWARRVAGCAGPALRVGGRCSGWRALRAAVRVRGAGETHCACAQAGSELPLRVVPRARALRGLPSAAPVLPSAPHATALRLAAAGPSPAAVAKRPAARASAAYATGTGTASNPARPAQHVRSSACARGPCCPGCRPGPQLRGSSCSAVHTHRHCVAVKCRARHASRRSGVTGL